MKISIIIPTWNRENLIKKAIKSAQNQTIKDIEILICDDGSTDNTKKTIEEISKSDPRVKWLEGKHSGRPAIPRNNGIKNAKGEWLAFLDSDDEWFPKKLENQLRLLANTGFKASSTNAYSFTPATDEKKIYSNFDKKIINFSDLLISNKVITSSVLLHNSLINKITGFPPENEQKGFEDYSLWLRVATQTDFAYIETPTLLYTDDAMNSIRGITINDSLIQKKYIFSNFLKWAIKNKINKNTIALILIKYTRNYFKIKLTTLKKIIKRLLKK